jgi:hypothetical protein
MSVTPNQVQYLSPFCDDTPESIGKWVQVYNLFVRIGDDTDTGYNSTRMSSIFSDIPYATGRIYDSADTSFNCSLVSPVLTVTGGSVIINNTLIEVSDFDIDLSDTYSRWSPNGYNTWSFMPSVTTYCYLCVIFDPYNNDGTVKTSEPAATVAFVQEDDIDFEIMAPIWVAKVVKNSGGVITSATDFLLEYSSLTYKIEQLGYWKEFIVDGGDLG